jgi:hypothetical protein
MRLERGELSLSGPAKDEMPRPRRGAVLLKYGQTIELSGDDLRWLCVVAGPALLNELEKGASDGDR